MPSREVFRRGDDITIVIGQVLVSTGRGQDAPARYELPVIEQPAELLRPFVLLQVSRFRRGDAARHPIHHLPGFGFYRLVDMLQIAHDNLAIEQRHRDLGQVDIVHPADLALARPGVDDHDDRVADRKACPRHVLLGVAIEKDLVAKFVQCAGLLPVAVS